MRIIWQDNAKASFKHIAQYIKGRFGLQAKRDFVLRVQQQESLLKRHPNIGIIDPLFADRPIAYRSVIVGGLSKMVYRVDDSVIHVVAFWDTRREPTAQAKQVE